MPTGIKGRHSRSKLIILVNGYVNRYLDYSTHFTIWNGRKWHLCPLLSHIYILWSCLAPQFSYLIPLIFSSNQFFPTSPSPTFRPAPLLSEHDPLHLTGDAGTSMGMLLSTWARTTFQWPHNWAVSHLLQQPLTASILWETGGPHDSLSPLSHRIMPVSISITNLTTKLNKIS